MKRACAVFSIIFLLTSCRQASGVGLATMTMAPTGTEEVDPVKAILAAKFF